MTVRSCNATSKRTGKPCGATPPTGAVVCRWHGGEAPRARNKAAERRLTAELTGLLAGHDVTPVDNPLAALRQVAGRVLRWLDVAEARVDELGQLEVVSEDGAEQARAIVVIYERAMDRAHRALVDIARLNLDERLAAIDERLADQVGALIRGVLSDLGVDTDEPAVSAAVARRLVALPGGAS